VWNLKLSDSTGRARMTEPDILSRNIETLKERQRAAWQHLSDPALTAFERRETRNQIKQSGTELRSYLEMMSERLRFRPPPTEADTAGLSGQLDFRLLAMIGSAGP
jgi:hypothetical protein